MDEQYTAERLLVSIARGENDALKTLYEQTSPKLFAIALRICQDRDLAEKALQQSYTAVWRRASSFDARQNSGMAWLSRIVRNRALALMPVKPTITNRADGVYQPNDVSQPADIPLPNLATARVDYPELDKLMTSLDKLDGPARQAVLLAYFEGRPRTELARRADMPAPTLTKHLRRGLDKLRVALERVS